MSDAHELGICGEELAQEYLLKKGLYIVEKNWRFGTLGEVDIIVLDKKAKELVFVEVKTRRDSIENAKELVHEVKKEKIRRLAKAFLYVNDINNVACRFDVIAIKISNRENKLEHIQCAF